MYFLARRRSGSGPTISTVPWAELWHARTSAQVCPRFEIELGVEGCCLVLLLLNLYAFVEDELLITSYSMDQMKARLRLRGTPPAIQQRGLEDTRSQLAVPKPGHPKAPKALPGNSCAHAAPVKLQRLERSCALSFHRGRG